LAFGDRLGFVLRANATKDRRVPETAWGRRPDRRVDLVMDALHKMPGQSALGSDRISERPSLRMKLADQVATDWLAAQGGRGGFVLERVRVEDYSVRQLSRPAKGRVTFGVLDVSGILSVNEPDTFLATIGTGLGRARAFGCGLMLIRRV
jgi:CRISPR system Cascade subunit CasE